jgi:hypothetical protein
MAAGQEKTSQDRRQGPTAVTTSSLISFGLGLYVAADRWHDLGRPFVTWCCPNAIDGNLFNALSRGGLPGGGLQGDCREALRRDACLSWTCSRLALTRFTAAAPWMAGLMLLISSFFKNGPLPRQTSHFGTHRPLVKNSVLSLNQG